MKNTSDCIRSIELHGTICISYDDWRVVKEKIESEYLSENCDDCSLTLKVNENGNLSLECTCVREQPESECCIDIGFMEGRGHRADCKYFRK